MSGIVQLLEESLVAFVKERVPTREWKDIYCRYGIEGRMEDDDLNELKDLCFNELMNEVSWKAIVRHIRELAENQLIETDSEKEEESEPDSESTNDDSEG